ncbi:MAG: NAD(P)-dependent alcohol dehydrogenase [Chloroflexi bacterium]|nr:NAD(P)-dependent alcohol dehydrogenase [Chloroflexota bacterium]
MKAVVCTRYGPPEVLQVQEVETPIPKDNEVRIKIYATTVTPSDGLLRSGSTIESRIFIGFAKPRKTYQIPGTEFSGVIDRVGSAVTHFKPGDEVYGFRGFGTGACAEYKTMREGDSLALKPGNLSHAEAAALVDGASTALFFLRDKASIQPGQKVLINGASGSIGSYAIQLAKHFGARVTGVCSTRNIDLVTSLGADRVIDYTTEDFTQSGESYDIIFDTVGKSTFAACRPILAERGLYLVTTGNMLVNYVMTLWTSVFSKKRMIFALSVDKREALNFLRELAEEGKIRPIVDRRYPLEDVVDAHHYLDTGRKRGNVVITVVQAT